MFNLTKANATLRNWNPRSERHGEDRAMAGDVAFIVAQPNAVLEHFDSNLRPALFRQVRSGEQQRLDGEDAWTGVLLPKVKPLRWDEEWPGYRLEICEGLGLTEPLIFEDVTVRKFSFAPVEGGTVNIGFSVIVHPDAPESGQLHALQLSEVVVSLTPPVKQHEAQPDLLDQGDAANDQLQQAADALGEKAAA